MYFRSKNQNWDFCKFCSFFSMWLLLKSNSKLNFKMQTKMANFNGIDEDLSYRRNLQF